MTLEGHTYQPNSESIEPDIENLQIVAFGQGRTAQEALENTLKERPYLLSTSFNELIAAEVADSNREYFCLDEFRQ